MLFLSADVFSKSTFLKNSYRNTTRVSNSLDPDQARHFVGPILGPNCLQRLTANDIISCSGPEEKLGHKFMIIYK